MKIVAVETLDGSTGREKVTTTAVVGDTPPAPVNGVSSSMESRLMEKYRVRERLVALPAASPHAAVTTLVPGDRVTGRVKVPFVTGAGAPLTVHVTLVASLTLPVIATVSVVRTARSGGELSSSAGAVVSSVIERLASACSPSSSRARTIN